MKNKNHKYHSQKILNSSNPSRRYQKFPNNSSNSQKNSRKTPSANHLQNLRKSWKTRNWWKMTNFSTKPSHNRKNQGKNSKTRSNNSCPISRIKGRIDKIKNRLLRCNSKSRSWPMMHHNNSNNMIKLLHLKRISHVSLMTPPRPF